MLLLILISIIIVVYTLLFIKLSLTLKEKKQLENCETDYAKSISILVPFRNESENILTCLNSLKEQQCKNGKYEVILINDHSEDDSCDKADNFIKNNNLTLRYKIISLPEKLAGKKAAINLGIEESVGELIISTDADCTFNKNWIQHLLCLFNTETHFVFGPVVYRKESGFLQYFFSLEFLTMVNVGIAMAKWNMPVYCNAANMAFRKKSYYKIIEDISGKECASGDDVFTLHAFHKYFPKGIKATSGIESVVFTQSQQNLKEILNQRLRWYSKSAYYKYMPVKILMYLIGITNISLLALILYSAINPDKMWFCLIIFTIKCSIDFCFIFLGTVQMKKTKLLRVFLPAVIIYPFYLFVLVFLKYVMPVNWKDRKIYS